MGFQDNTPANSNTTVVKLVVALLLSSCATQLPGVWPDRAPLRRLLYNSKTVKAGIGRWVQGSACCAGLAGTSYGLPLNTANYNTTVCAEYLKRLIYAGGLATTNFLVENAHVTQATEHARTTRIKVLPVIIFLHLQAPCCSTKLHSWHYTAAVPCSCARFTPVRGRQ